METNELIKKPRKDAVTFYSHALFQPCGVFLWGWSADEIT